MESILNLGKNVLMYGGGMFLAFAAYLYYNQNNMLYIPNCNN